MKKSILILMLIFPFVASAQFDDIYFVPKKEKKVVVISNENDNVYVDDEELYVTDDVESMYYTNDPYEYYDNDDYQYSTRIVRFRSPGSLVGSNLYWDLRYNCGINDWLVYDNGYTVDIYPTYNNSAYYWPYIGYTPYSNWWSWSNLYSPYCYWDGYHWGYSHYHPSYHWNSHYHFPHAGYHSPYWGHHSARPTHKVHTDIPVNKNLTGRVNGAGRGNSVNTGVPVNNRGGNAVSGRPASQTTNRVPSNGQVNTTNKRTDSRSTGVRREPVQRRAVSTPENRSNSREQQGMRKQLPPRTTMAPIRSVGNVRSGQQNGSVTNVRSGQQRKPQSQTRSSEERSNYRSNSSSSSGYNRPSSTSVSRQRSYSSGSRPSSGRSSGGGSSRSSSGARNGARR